MSEEAPPRQLTAAELRDANLALSCMELVIAIGGVLNAALAHGIISSETNDTLVDQLDEVFKRANKITEELTRD